MISYHGVIRKRLRLKGHPEIPPYKETATPSEDAIPSSEQTAVETPQPDPTEEDEITPVRPKHNTDDNVENEHNDRSDSHTGKSDTRTAAEQRHDEIMLAREAEHLRKEASKSYSDKLNVRYTKYNPLVRLVKKSQRRVYVY